VHVKENLLEKPEFIFYRKPLHYGMASALGLWRWP